MSTCESGKPDPGDQAGDPRRHGRPDAQQRRHQDPPRIRPRRPGYPACAPDRAVSRRRHHRSPPAAEGLRVATPQAREYRQLSRDWRRSICHRASPDRHRTQCQCEQPWQFAAGAKNLGRTVPTAVAQHHDHLDNDHPHNAADRTWVRASRSRLRAGNLGGYSWPATLPEPHLCTTGGLWSVACLRRLGSHPRQSEHVAPANRSPTGAGHRHQCMLDYLM